MARDIHLDGFRTEESKGLFSLAKDMISSWMEKPQEKSTMVWLGEEFIQRVGGMTTAAAQELSSSIMDGVDQFTENMNAIEETYRSGGTKETWLQQKLLSVPGTTEEERARYLAEAQVALAAGNNEVYAALHSAEQSADLRLPAAVEERVPEGAGGASWQPIPAQVAAQGVAEQAVLAGVGGAALDTGLKCAEIQDGEPLNTGIDLGEEPTGSETDRSIKAIATGALYVAVERGIVPFSRKRHRFPCSRISPVGVLRAYVLPRRCSAGNSVLRRQLTAWDASPLPPSAISAQRASVRVCSLRFPSSVPFLAWRSALRSAVSRARKLPLPFMRASRSSNLP